MELLRATFFCLILVSNCAYTLIFGVFGVFGKPLFSSSFLDFPIEKKKHFWHPDSGRFSHLRLQQILSDLFAVDWRRTRASAQAGTSVITVQR